MSNHCLFLCCWFFLFSLVQVSVLFNNNLHLYIVLVISSVVLLHVYLAHQDTLTWYNTYHKSEVTQWTCVLSWFFLSLFRCHFILSFVRSIASSFVRSFSFFLSFFFSSFFLPTVLSLFYLLAILFNRILYQHCTWYHSSVV